MNSTLELNKKISSLIHKADPNNSPLSNIIVYNEVIKGIFEYMRENSSNSRIEVIRAKNQERVDNAAKIVAMTQGIEEKTKANIAELEKAESQYSKLKAEYSDLQKKKIEIDDAISKQEKMIKQCEASDDQLENSSIELLHFAEKLKDVRETLEETNKQLNEKRTEYEKYENMLHDGMKDKESVEEKLIQVRTELHQVSVESTSKQQTLTDIENNIEGIRATTQKLLEEIKSIDKEDREYLEIWRKHFGTNDTILESLHESKNDTIVRIRKTIEDQLTEYDEALKVMLDSSLAAFEKDIQTLELEIDAS